MLEAWASVAPTDTAFEELLEILPSPKCVSEGMQAGISWMASVYAAGKGTTNDCITSAAKAVAIGAGYKTVPVREAAGQLLEAMIATVGLPAVQGAVQGLDKNLQKAAAEALAKCCVSGGAAAVAPAAAAVAAPGSRPGTAASAGSRPPSRNGVAGVRASTTLGGAGSRPSTAGSAAGRSIAGSGSNSISRSSVAGSAASLAALGSDDGPLLSMDRNKEERARKVRAMSNPLQRHQQSREGTPTNLSVFDCYHGPSATFQVGMLAMMVST